MKASATSGRYAAAPASSAGGVSGGSRVSALAAVETGTSKSSKWDEDQELDLLMDD